MSALGAKSPSATATLQVPPDPTVAVLAPVTKPDTVTVAPASPVPVRLKPPEFSKAFTRLSVDTSLIAGAAGACKSVVTVTVAAALTLPTKSVCVTEKSVVASAFKSAEDRSTLQLPSLFTVSVLVAAPPVTVTAAPASPVPLRVTVALPAISLAPTMLSEETAVITGVSTEKSVVTVKLAAELTFPAASV